MTHIIGKLKMLDAKKIKFLVVHCSDTPNEDNIGAIEIHKMHLNFGWNGIGYHKIIRRNGKIEDGRPEFWIGAHTKGLNKESLGVCLIGRNIFTKNQFNSLEKVLRKWKLKYPLSQIKGHKDAISTNKTCPNFDLKLFLKQRSLS